MLEFAALTSLKIVFVWGAMQEGMVLFPLRRFIEFLLTFFPVRVFLLLRKPFFDCLFCMASVWGFIFSFRAAAFSWDYFCFLFTVAGFNYILQASIINERETR